MKIKNRIASKVSSRGQLPRSPLKASGPPRHTQARGGTKGKGLSNYLNHGAVNDDDRDNISIDATVHTFGSLANDYDSVFSC
mmetsp:Transcript_12523/g.18807  ORF Transcript_12523/g.18807 Transcript_12523/m.18807 type:complete len:82 (+) Transcript_12523:556-801(+)